MRGQSGNGGTSGALTTGPPCHPRRPLPCFRSDELPGFRQQLLQKRSLDPRQTQEHCWIWCVVIRQIARLCLFRQECLTPLDADSNHEGVWLCGFVCRLTSEQSTLDLESRTSKAGGVSH